MQLFTAGRMRLVLASIVILFSFPQASLATPIFTFSSTSTFNLAPSSDSIVLQAGASTPDTNPNLYDFQIGTFDVGDSEIPDQLIPFVLQDTFTLNGVTETLNIYGQDNVTDSADVLTILAGAPVAFGNEVFTLQSFSVSATTIGAQLPIALEATVTPEPRSLLLLATGLLAGGLFYATKRSPKAADKPVSALRFGPE